MCSETDDRLARYKHRLDMCHDLKPGEAAWLIAEVERLRELLLEITSDD